jgi:hypothetical protein
MQVNCAGTRGALVGAQSCKIGSCLRIARMDAEEIPAEQVRTVRNYYRCSSVPPSLPLTAPEGSSSANELAALSCALQKRAARS